MKALLYCVSSISPTLLLKFLINKLLYENVSTPDILSPSRYTYTILLVKRFIAEENWHIKFFSARQALYEL